MNGSRTTTTYDTFSSPPLLYTSPVASSALITAFGRPTLIEYDASDRETDPNDTSSLRRSTGSRASTNSDPIAAYTYRLKATTGSPHSTMSDEELPTQREDHERPTSSPRHLVPPEIIHTTPYNTSPPLKLWPLAILVFYNVSGGPFGIEPSIRAAGNFFALLGFVLFPFVWALPEALVTAELGSTFMDPSAGVTWVEEAFGERMGGLCGYLGWISGATDNVRKFLEDRRHIYTHIYRHSSYNHTHSLLPYIGHLSNLVSRICHKCSREQTRYKHMA